MRLMQDKIKKLNLKTNGREMHKYFKQFESTYLYTMGGVNYNVSKCSECW